MNMGENVLKIVTEKKISQTQANSNQELLKKPNIFDDLEHAYFYCAQHQRPAFLNLKNFVIAESIQRIS